MHLLRHMGLILPPPASAAKQSSSLLLASLPAPSAANAPSEHPKNRSKWKHTVSMATRTKTPCVVLPSRAPPRSWGGLRAWSRSKRGPVTAYRYLPSSTLRQTQPRICRQDCPHLALPAACRGKRQPAKKWLGVVVRVREVKTLWTSCRFWRTRISSVKRNSKLQGVTCVIRRIRRNRVERSRLRSRNSRFGLIGC